MLNALAVLRFLHNLSYGIVHELRHAVSIISLGKKPTLVVLPRLPAAVGVAVVGQTACLVVLVVYDRAVGKVCLNDSTVEVSVIATFRTIETLFKFVSLISVNLIPLNLLLRTIHCQSQIYRHLQIKNQKPPMTILYMTFIYFQYLF